MKKLLPLLLAISLQVACVVTANIPANTTGKPLAEKTLLTPAFYRHNVSRGVYHLDAPRMRFEDVARGR